MSVILENKGKREYQTLSNAYYFVAEMFKTDKFGKMPIDEYMDSKEANDPIKKFFAVAVLWLQHFPLCKCLSMNMLQVIHKNLISI